MSLKQLAENRQEVLSSIGGETLNIFNFERFQRFMDPSHIEEIFRRSDSFKVLFIAKSKDVPNYILDLCHRYQVQLAFLPVDVYDRETEVLITNGYVFLADGEHGWHIKSPAFFRDAKKMFYALWKRSERIV